MRTCFSADQWVFRLVDLGGVVRGPVVCDPGSVGVVFVGPPLRRALYRVAVRGGGETGALSPAQVIDGGLVEVAGFNVSSVALAMGVAWAALSGADIDSSRRTGAVITAWLPIRSSRGGRLR